MRIMGRVPTGTISRWSLAYVRVWLKAGIVQSASHWLSGTLLWPVWLRGAGMKIGRGSEISTIIDTIPELVEIGTETFFADGIYLGGPHIHKGTVTLAMTRLGKNTFLGNHAVVAAGQDLPDDILLGVCTVADDSIVRPGTSWFGHPPFELPNREIVEVDRSLTHNPTLVRYVSRVYWELLRFTLPLAPLLLGLVALNLLVRAEEVFSMPALLLGVVPAVEFGFLASMCLLVLVLKWVLLGRVVPGVHPLYSSWCSRWDFHYVVWDIFGLAPLSALEGTLLLNWYLRAMGMRIGRHVVLGNGFAHVVDPDMLEFEDGATVSCQFQAHTFEDRVLKIDYVLIRRQATVGNLAVLLYGADIGDNTSVTPHSVVMKRERLLPNHSYAGGPTRVLN
jgi:non-ribosomal peptide synthetase-like protein